MAPKSARTLASKRSLEVGPAATAPAKKSKAETDPALHGVLEALRQADIPEDCRAMLIATVPCLNTPAADRQKLSTMFVNMIGEAIDERCKALEQAVADEQVKLANVEQSRTVREAKVVEAEAAFADRSAEVNERIGIFETSSKLALDARKTVEEMLKRQQEFTLSLAGASDEKTLIEKALADNLLPLKQGCEPSDAMVHADVLVPLASRIKLDESLVVALPGFCKKQPSERGAFDEIISKQLEEQMRQKVSELAQLLADSEASKAEHATAVEAAQRGAEKAAEQQNTAAAQLETAKSSQLQASVAVEEAKADALAFEPEHRHAAKALDDKQAALQNFVSVNVASYEALKGTATALAGTAAVADEQGVEA